MASDTAKPFNDIPYHGTGFLGQHRKRRIKQDKQLTCHHEYEAEVSSEPTSLITIKCKKCKHKKVL